MSTLVPVAQSYLNYDGDVRDGLTVGQRMGPTTYGAWVYVVSWEYDAEADRTVVGLSAVRP
jgi:hypothetical protein